MKVKSPFQACAGLPTSVPAAPLVLSNVLVPEIVKVPEPRASSVPRFNVPAFSSVPPVCAAATFNVREPLPALRSTPAVPPVTPTALAKTTLFPLVSTVPVTPLVRTRREDRSSACPLQRRVEVPVKVMRPDAPKAPPLKVSEPALRVVVPTKPVFVPPRVSAEVELFWVMPVTFAPMTLSIDTEAAPAPAFVIEPVLLIDVVERVMPVPLELLALSVRSPVPVIPPVRVVEPVVPVAWMLRALLSVTAPPKTAAVVVPLLPMVSVLPLLPATTLIGLVNVPLLANKLAFAVPEECPRLMTLPSAPNVFPLAPPMTVPALIVRPPDQRLATAPSVRLEVALSWTTPVTFVPMTALMRTALVPVPELVIVPVLLTPMVVSCIALVIELLLFFKIRLPVPVIPPDTVSTARVPAPETLLVSVVPPLFTSSAVTVRGV